MDWSKKWNIRSVLVSDREAVDACLRFYETKGIVVEPACGAAMAAVYEKKIENLSGPLIVIVCGGSTATLDDLNKWHKTLQ